MRINFRPHVCCLIIECLTSNGRLLADQWISCVQGSFCPERVALFLYDTLELLSCDWLRIHTFKRYLMKFLLSAQWLLGARVMHRLIDLIQFCLAKRSLKLKICITFNVHKTVQKQEISPFWLDIHVSVHTHWSRRFLPIIILSWVIKFNVHFLYL